MLDKVIDYFNSEYTNLVKVLECKRKGNGFKWATERELVNHTITICFAVAQFSQTIGVQYEEIKIKYEELKKMCENLLIK